MLRKINMAPHAAGDEASFKFGGAANLGRAATSANGELLLR
jgi:hypothetical protein